MPVFLPGGDDLLDLGDASQASLEVDWDQCLPSDKAQMKTSQYCLLGSLPNELQCDQHFRGGV